MKKFLSVILALVMVFSLSVTALAADVDAGAITGSTSQNVTATYEEGSVATNAGNIYSVKLTWTDVTVSYKGAVGGTYTWDPTSLTYKLTGNAVAEWTDGTVKIGVENRSNDAITATASYEKVGDETLVFSGALNLGSAAIDTNNGNAVIEYNDTATSGKEQTGTITGTMGGAISESGTLGTITVTLTHD